MPRIGHLVSYASAGSPVTVTVGSGGDGNYCGSGTDSVHKDAADTAATDCENVT